MHTLCFDLDGTLSDPKVGITRSIIHALTELDRAAPEADELEWCIGPPLADSLEKLLGNTRDANLAIIKYRERYSAIGALENTLYEGIRPLLETLKEAGHSLFVATSKAEIFAQKILDHFQIADLFENIYGAELDGTRSDKTDLLAYLLKKEDLDPAQTIMIGDRKYDIIGALNNHIRPIGVTYGYGSKSELQDAGASHLCDTPRALSKFLAQL
ncbi:MAG: HAD hydrolase-like protein [Sneathiella sp.]